MAMVLALVLLPALAPVLKAGASLSVFALALPIAITLGKVAAFVAIMPKEPVTPPRPQPAEPQQPPVKDPQPYKDPVEPPPRDPQEDRPMRDPVEPDADRPRS